MNHTCVSSHLRSQTEIDVFLHHPFCTPLFISKLGEEGAEVIGCDTLGGDEVHYARKLNATGAGRDVAPAA